MMKFQQFLENKQTIINETRFFDWDDEDMLGDMFVSADMGDMNFNEVDTEWMTSKALYTSIDKTINSYNKIINNPVDVIEEAFNASAKVRKCTNWNDASVKSVGQVRNLSFLSAINGAGRKKRYGLGVFMDDIKADTYTYSANVAWTPKGFRVFGQVFQYAFDERPEVIKPEFKPTPEPTKAKVTKAKPAKNLNEFDATVSTKMTQDAWDALASIDMDRSNSNSHKIYTDSTGAKLVVCKFNESNNRYYAVGTWHGKFSNYEYGEIDTMNYMDEETLNQLLKDLFPA